MYSKKTMKHLNEIQPCASLEAFPDLTNVRKIECEITYIPDQFQLDEEREEFLNTLRS